MNILPMSFIEVLGRPGVGEQWMGRKGPDCRGLTAIALHSSVGTFRIRIIANINGIVQCTAWMAVHGSPAGSTPEAFLLEDAVEERTPNQELGDLSSSSTFISDLPRALGKHTTSLSLTFPICKTRTFIPVPLDLSHQTWPVSRGFCGILDRRQLL